MLHHTADVLFFAGVYEKRSGICIIIKKLLQVLGWFCPVTFLRVLKPGKIISVLRRTKQSRKYFGRGAFKNNISHTGTLVFCIDFLYDQDDIFVCRTCGVSAGIMKNFSLFRIEIKKAKFAFCFLKLLKKIQIYKPVCRPEIAAFLLQRSCCKNVGCVDTQISVF